MKYTDKQQYIQEVCGFVKWKKARPGIQKELCDHIDDQCAAYIAEGVPPFEAEKKAVKQMGSAAEVGKMLDDAYRPKISFGMFAALLLLCLFGMWANFSLNGISDCIPGIAVGAALFAAVYFSGASVLKKHAVMIYAAYCVLNTAVLIFGAGINGRRGYIAGGAFSVQYFALLFPAIYAAVISACGKNSIKSLVMCAFLGVLPIMLQLIQPSFNTAFMLFLTVIIMLIFAVNKNIFGTDNKTAKNLLVIIPGTVISAFTAVALAVKSYRVWQPNGKNYIQYSLLEFIKNSSFFGAAENELELIGGVAVNKDFYLAALINKHGYITAACLAVAAAAVIYAMFKIGKRQTGGFSKLITLGTAVMFALQSVGYILFNLGLFGSGVMPMPFVSGNASTAVNMLAFGVMLSAFRNDSLIIDKSVSGADNGERRITYANGKLILKIK